MPPSVDSSDNENHRDETFEIIDSSRRGQLMQMIRTAVARDNKKQVTKILGKKERRMSSVALEKMQSLWTSMLEFENMFQGKEASIRNELYYQEALIEILRQMGDQTGSWKLVLYESVDPFSGKLVIESLTMWGIQIRECQLFHQRADAIASNLRKKFEEANPQVKVSEDEESDQEDPPNSENGQDGRRDDKIGSPQAQKDPDFSDLSDNSFFGRLNGVSCNILATDPVEKDPPDSELLSFEPRGPSVDPATGEPFENEVGNEVGNEAEDVVPPSSPSLIPKRPSTLTKDQNSVAMKTPAGPSYLSPPSLTEINPSTSSPMRIHRDENIVDHRPIDRNEINFQNRVDRVFHKHGRIWDENRASAERLSRDREGASRYLQNSIMSTRSYELNTAQKWGRSGAIQHREHRGQVKRGSSLNYPVPKRSRSVQVQRMREMNRQFEECLSLYQRMDHEMKSFQQFQPVEGNAGVIKRNCKHCSNLAGKPVFHAGPFGGRKNCFFDQSGRKKHAIYTPTVHTGSPNFRQMH